jgi:hypothetical protein
MKDLKPRNDNPINSADFDKLVEGINTENAQRHKLLEENIKKKIELISSLVSTRKVIFEKIKMNNERERYWKRWHSNYDEAIQQMRYEYEYSENEVRKRIEERKSYILNLTNVSNLHTSTYHNGEYSTVSLTKPYVWNESITTSDEDFIAIHELF